MSDLRFSFPASVVAAKGHITPTDVGLMRRHLWPEGLRSRHHVSMAIGLDDLRSTTCPEWTDYLVEAVAAYAVWGESTSGVVSEHVAGWLLEQLAEGGVVRTPTGLKILVHVLDVAAKVPDFLSATALNQVRLALLPEPRGAYSQARAGTAALSIDDLAFIWRVLRSRLERGQVTLSRGEQLVLHAIHHLQPSDAVPRGWSETMTLTRMATPTDHPLAERRLDSRSPVHLIDHQAA